MRRCIRGVSEGIDRGRNGKDIKFIWNMNGGLGQQAHISKNVRKRNVTAFNRRGWRAAKNLPLPEYIYCILLHTSCHLRVKFTINLQTICIMYVNVQNVLPSKSVTTIIPMCNGEVPGSTVAPKNLTRWGPSCFSSFPAGKFYNSRCTLTL